MLDLFNQSWFGSVVGLLGLLVGLGGLILYRISRIGARPTSQMKTLRLIGQEEQELPKEVSILFKGDSVPRLSLTSWYFWNSGKETIQRSQIVGDDPLKCSFDDVDQILNAHAANYTRKVNKFAVEIPPDSKNEALLSFDFLDPGDGVRVDLLHTSRQRYPQISGTFRGIPKGILQITSATASSFDQALKRIFIHRKLLYGIVLFVGLVSFLFGLFPESWLSQIKGILESKKEAKTTDSIIELRVAFLSIGALYAFLAGAVLYMGRKKYPAVLDADSNRVDLAEPRLAAEPRVS